MDVGGRQRIWNGTCWAVAVGLYAVLWLVTWRYYFRYPFSDEWSFIPLLDEALRGEATLGDLWAPYHGHRLFFARLVMVPVAVWTHWDPRWFVLGNLFLGLALFGLCVAMAREAFAKLSAPLPGSLVVTFAAFIFSLHQWCNWAWGWQFLVYMSVAAVVAGLFLLGSGNLGWARLAAAVACGVVASFSFATGMVIWGAGLAMLLMPLLYRERVWWRGVIVWCVASVIVGIAFLTGFTHPDYHESGFLPKNLLVLVPYVLTYLGASLTFFVPLERVPFDPAWIVGLGGLLFAIGAHAYLIWRRLHWSVLAPFTGLMLFALGSGILTGLGRSAQFGARQAAAARYFTITEFFWVGVAVLVVLMARTWEGKQRHRRARGRVFVSVALVGLTVAALLSGRMGFYRLDEHYKVYMPEARRMVVQDLDEVPARLNPVNRSLEEELAILKKWELFCFRPEVREEWE